MAETQDRRLIGRGGHAKPGFPRTGLRPWGGRSTPAKPATFADLSPETSSKAAGYVIAKQAWFTVGPVTKVSYVAADGKTKTLSGAALKALEKEYTYGASTIKPVG